MGIFSRVQRKDKTTRKPLRTVSIQASGPEGVPRQVLLDSMLTGLAVNQSVPGTINAFKTYDTQVAATYDKYNGLADFGNQQTRAVIDLRTALIAGEGISVSAENDATAEWIEDFIDVNNFKGEDFINAVKGAEMAGQSLMALKMSEDKVTAEPFVKVVRLPYYCSTPYRVIYTDKFIKDEISHIEIRRDGVWERLLIGKFVYIRTGGDDANSAGPVTKTGVVLTDIENYDRAVRDIRRLNHVLARITPSFETKSETETSALKKWLQANTWKIGNAFLGTAKFKYETPGSGAHENLVTELTTAIKNISATTGVPVHWLGYVDLMSNRSTADSLYEMIKHATILERTAWQTTMYQLILLAQEHFIDSGGMGLTFDPDFEVKLPLIDFSDFFERVKALSKAFADSAISMADYRNQLPGIDPLKTAKAVEAEEEENITQLVKLGIPTIPETGDEDGEGNEDGIG